MPHLRRPPARPQTPLPLAPTPAHAHYPLASPLPPAPTLAPRGCDDRCALRYKVLTAPLSALPHRAARLTAVFVQLEPAIAGLEPEPETEEEKKARKKKEKKAKKKKAKEAELEDGAVLNAQVDDPFAVDSEAVTGGSKDAGYVHIRVQKRNGRKCITTITGLNPKIDQKKLIKHFTKEFSCAGNIQTDPDFGEVIQLQGDQRMKIAEFLVAQKIAKKANIKVHGF